MLSVKDPDDGDVSLEEYNKKFESMQKYIPFLEKMMDHLKDNQEKTAQLDKIQSLYNIVTNTKKKLKYETLRKCEDGLKKLYHKIEKTNFFPNSPILTKDANVPKHKKSTSETKSTPASPSPPSSPAVCYTQTPILIPTERRMSPVGFEKSKAEKDVDHRSNKVKNDDETKVKIPTSSLMSPRPVDPPLSTKDLENLLSDTNSAPLNTEEKELDELEQLRKKLVQAIQNHDNDSETDEKVEKPTKKIEMFGPTDVDERVNVKPVKVTPKPTPEPAEPIKYDQTPASPSYFADSNSPKDNKFVRLADKYQRKPRSTSTDSEVDNSFNCEYVPTGRGLTSRELERFGASGNLPPAMLSPTHQTHENRENKTMDNRPPWSSPSPMEWTSSPISPPIQSFSTPPRMPQVVPQGFISPYTGFDQRCPPVPPMESVNDPYSCYRNRNFRPPEPYKQSTNNPDRPMNHDFHNGNRQVSHLMPQNAPSGVHSNFIRPPFNETPRVNFNQFNANNMYNMPIMPQVPPQRPAFSTNLMKAPIVPPLAAPPLPPAALMRMDYRIPTNTNDYRNLNDTRRNQPGPYRAVKPCQTVAPGPATPETARSSTKPENNIRDPRRRTLDDVSDNDPRKQSIEKRFPKSEPKRPGGYDPRTIPKKPANLQKSNNTSSSSSTNSSSKIETVSSSKSSLQNFKIPKIKKVESEPKPEEHKVEIKSETTKVVEENKDEPQPSTSDVTQNPEISSNTDEHVNETRPSPPSKTDEKETVINNLLLKLQLGEIDTLISALGKLGETLSLKKMKRLQQLLKSDSESDDDENDVKEKRKSKANKKSEFKPEEDNVEKNVEKNVEQNVEESAVTPKVSKKSTRKTQNKKDEVLEVDEKEQKKPKRRSDLEMLQDDIRDMFICKGVLTATGHRMCRILKENQDKGKTSPDNSTETGKKKITRSTAEEILPLLPKTRLRSSSISSSVSTSSTEGSTKKSPRVPRVMLEKTELVKVNTDEPKPVPNTKRPSRTRKRNNVKSTPKTEPPKLEPEKIETTPKEMSSNLSLSPSKTEPPKLELAKIDIIPKEILSHLPFLNRNKKHLPELRKTKRTIFQTKIANVVKRLHKKTPSGSLDTLFPNSNNKTRSKPINTLSAPDCTQSKPDRTRSKVRTLREKKREIDYSESNEKVDKIDKETLVSKVKDIPVLTDKEIPVSTETSEENEKIEDAITENVDIDSHDKNYFYEGYKKYLCRLCPFYGKMIVHHYKLTHDEVLISRLSPDIAQSLIEQSKEKDYENMQLEESLSKDNKRKRFSKFCCVFCSFVIEFDFTETFSDHMSSHTGEDRFKCPKCSFTTATRSALRAHYSYNHPKVRYSGRDENFLYPTPPNVAILFGYLCSECHYVQIHRENTEKHVAKYHTNDESVKIYTVNMSSVETVVVEKKISKPPVAEETVEKEVKTYSLREKTINEKKIEEEPQTETIVEKQQETEIKIKLEPKDDTDVVNETKQDEILPPVKKSEPINFLAFVCEEAAEPLAEPSVDEFLNAAEEIPIDTLDFSKSKFESFLESLTTKLCDDPTKSMGQSSEENETIDMDVDTLAKQSREIEEISRELKKIKSHIETVPNEPDTSIKPVETPVEINSVVGILDNLREFEKRKHFINNTIVKLATITKQDPETINADMNIESDIAEDEEYLNCSPRSEPETTESESSDNVLIDFGLFGVKEGDSKLVYFCSNLSSCPYVSDSAEDFSEHIDTKHKMDCWDGDCFECETTIDNNGKKRTIRDAYNHFVSVHLEKLLQIVSIKSIDNTEAVSSIDDNLQDDTSIVAREEVDKHSSLLSSVLSPSELCRFYKCMVANCDFTTNIPFDFLDHCTNTHKQETQQNRCAYCTITSIKSTLELITHMHCEHFNCVYQCGYCYYRCVSSTAIKLHHISRHKNMTDPVIYKLNKPITLPQGFKRDVKQTLSGQLPLRVVCKPYKCANCPNETDENDSKNSYFITSEFWKHLMDAHKFEALLCGLCKEEFLSVPNLMEHYVEHDIAEIQCLYCVTGMDRETAVHVHMGKYHTNHPHMVLYRRISSAFSSLESTIKSVEKLHIMDIRNLDLVQFSTIFSQSELINTKNEQFGPITTLTFDLNACINEISSNKVIDLNDKNDNNAEANKAESLTMADVDTKNFSEFSKTDNDDVEIIDIDTTNIDLTLDDEPNETLSNSLQNNDSVNNSEDFEVANENDDVVDPKYLIDDLPDEELLKKGLYGSDLYRCGSSPCTFLCESSTEFKNHIQKCPHTKVGYYKCFHCHKFVRHLSSVIDHLASHGIPRYKCGVCPFRGPLLGYTSKHLKKKHKASSIKVFPASRENFPVDLFIVVPKNKKIIPESPKKTPSKGQDKTITVISCGDEMKALPNQPILFFDIKCAKCSFTTRIKHNMSRHLHHHAVSDAVPEIGPVNPVPCLGKSEKMFDKMVNLACSSNPNLWLDKNKEKTKKATPDFVPENKRFVCGANDCTYLTVEEGMLRNHYRTLHSEETNYKCPHCKDSSVEYHNTINIDKIMNHLKMHGEKLYRCSHCPHYHYLKYIIEKHMADKHPTKSPFIDVIRELDIGQDEPAIEISKATPASSEVAQDNKPWKCGICTYSTITRNDILEHARVVHDIKSQFKCKLCPFKCSYDKNFGRHFASKHPGLQVQMIHVYYHEDGAAATEFIDNSPIWRRDECKQRFIRGIQVDETETPEGFYDGADETVVIPASAVKSTVKRRGPRPKQPRSGDNENTEHPTYLCPECKTYKTSSIKEFIGHMCKELQYERFKCCLCSTLYWDLDWFKHHLETEHDISWDLKYICLSHIYDETTEKSIIQNVMQQRGNVDFRFKLNDLSDIFPNNLVVPANDNNGIVCDNQTRTELNIAEVLRGMDQHWTYDARQTDKNVCPYCDYTSIYPRDVMKHIFRHWALRPFECGICQLKEYRAIDIYRHSTASHQNQRVQIFQLCDLKEIPIKAILKRQGGIVKEPELKVPRFNTSSDASVVRKLNLDSPESLNDQSNVSQDIDLNVSSESSMVIAATDTDPVTSSTLTENISINEDEEEEIFLCQYCPKRGASVNEIFEHWNIIHKNTRTATSQFKYRTSKRNQVPTRGRIMCLYCGLRGSKHYIRVHMKKYHPGKKMKTQQVTSTKPNIQVNCKDCDFFVFNVGLLRSHYSTSHPSKSFDSLYADLDTEQEEMIESNDTVAVNVLYKCKWCKNLCPDEESIKSHHQLLHSHLELGIETIENQVSTVKYCCSECLHQSESYPAMLEHIRSHAKPYKCRHCNLDFRFPGHVKYHSQKSHQGLPIDFGVDEAIVKKLNTIRANLKVSLENGKIIPIAEYRKRKHEENSTNNEAKKRKIELDTNPTASIQPTKMNQTARKSTTYIPPVVQMPHKKSPVAKKSTCPILKEYLQPQSKQSDRGDINKNSSEPIGFSYYGQKPPKEDNSSITVAMQFGGLPMKVNLNTLVHLTNKSFTPTLRIRDLKQAKTLSWS